MNICFGNLQQKMFIANLKLFLKSFMIEKSKKDEENNLSLKRAIINQKVLNSLLD